MEEPITFSTKITEKDLYKYNMHHAYTSAQGIFSILVSVLLMAAWIMQFTRLSDMYRVLYPVIALLFLIYIPFNLKLRSKQQMTQEVFMHPLTYTLKDDAIYISSPASEEPAILPWEYVYKIVTWQEYLLIYSNRVNAYIVPTADIMGNYDAIVNFIKAHVDDYKLTIRNRK